MRVLKARFIIEDKVRGINILRRLERYGRVCYKSEESSAKNGAADFIRKIIASGHESVIEHEKVTVRFICDRGVTHEVVRHRLAAYSQESTRYCNYTKGKFGSEISAIEPIFFLRQSDTKEVLVPSQWSFCAPHQLYIATHTPMSLNEFDVWFMGMLFAEWAYETLINTFKRSPQEARTVLPNSLKTEIVVTYNLREWRHFFKLRTSKKAHPQMRELTIPLLAEFKKKIPVIFEDIPVEE